MKKYLLTCPHDHGDCINHGLVNIDENNYVDGTPIEDFGMFIYRDEPFPEDQAGMWEIFAGLFEDQAFGLEDTFEGQTVSWWLENDKSRLKNAIIYGAADFKVDVEKEIWK